MLYAYALHTFFIQSYPTFQSIKTHLILQAIYVITFSKISAGSYTYALHNKAMAKFTMIDFYVAGNNDLFFYQIILLLIFKCVCAPTKVVHLDNIQVYSQLDLKCGINVF